VNLIFDVVSQEKREAVEAKIAEPVTESPPSRDTQIRAYYLLPAADSEDGTPVIDNLHRWLDKGLWGLGQRTGYRKNFAVGDCLCFYAVRIGIVVKCVIASPFFELSRKENPSTVQVPYAIRLREVRWLKKPVELTVEVRRQLSAFQGRDPSKGWAWFVQGTSKLTENDFNLLTSRIDIPEQKAAPKRSIRRGPPTNLVSAPKDYKGKTVQATIFQGKRYEAYSWKDATLALFEILRRQDQQQFESTALELVGRKRPYITHDRNALRAPQPISNTSLYVETNLSSNYFVKLCYTFVFDIIKGTHLAEL
jgi:hypothetical protein